MAISVAQLVPPQAMPAAQQVYFTTTGGARVDKVTICNTSSSEAKVSLAIVPATSSASNANTLTFSRAIAGGATWNCPDLVGQVLNRADTIQGVSDTDGALTIMISGITIT